MQSFRVIKPTAALVPYVRHYWVLSDDALAPVSERTLPVGCVQMVFHRGRQLFSLTEGRLQHSSFIRGQAFGYSDVESTGMLEIYPKYEGEARVIAISEDAKEKKVIHVKVRPEGKLEIPGWYSTNSSSYYLIQNNNMVVKRKGVGTWIVNSARPYGGGVMYNSSYIKIAPIMNPVQGDSIDLNILRHGSLKPQITEGIHRLYVEEVRESEVMLRGRGFKFLLPYEK